jgi:hypothetical protein
MRSMKSGVSLDIVMAGRSPSKTGVNALLTRPSTTFLLLLQKTWMPGARLVLGPRAGARTRVPGMTKERTGEFTDFLFRSGSQDEAG